jgi:hypothetical protein
MSPPPVPAIVVGEGEEALFELRRSFNEESRVEGGEEKEEEEEGCGEEEEKDSLE